jgi:exosortase/archaeosortase
VILSTSVIVIFHTFNNCGNIFPSTFNIDFFSLQNLHYLHILNSLYLNNFMKTNFESLNIFLYCTNIASMDVVVNIVNNVQYEKRKV